MIKYFIENKETNKWLMTSQGRCIDLMWDSSKTPNYSVVYSWTSDHHQASQYGAKEQAEYAIDSIWNNSNVFNWFKQQHKEDWIVTEHEFVHYRK